MTPPPAEPVFCAGAVILAAGRSRRMGRPKLLLPWGATTVLGHLLEQWRALGARQVAVVCAPDDEPLHEELDLLKVPRDERIVNPTPERGMFSSIQCAARWRRWQPALTHWAIVLGDQPHLRPDTLQAVLDFSAAHPASLCQPAQGGRRRHPVVLPKAIFLQLANSGATDLKDFSRAFATDSCELGDPGLPLDIDRPDDYENALKLFFG